MLKSKRWLLHGTIKTADAETKRKATSIIDKYSDDKNSKFILIIKISFQLVIIQLIFIINSFL